MPPRNEQEIREARLAKKRAYYHRNRDSERKKARDRAKRQKQKEQSAPEIADCKERHRLSQARYRERHRSLLNIRSLEYRLARKRRLAISADEEEYNRLMSLDYDDVSDDL